MPLLAGGFASSDKVLLYRRETQWLPERDERKKLYCQTTVLPWVRKEIWQQSLFLPRMSWTMGFQKLPDNRGMVYVPECACGMKKNTCPDCFSCQWCANERCRVCRGKQPGEKRKKKENVSGNWWIRLEKQRSVSDGPLQQSKYLQHEFAVDSKAMPLFQTLPTRSIQGLLLPCPVL